MPQSTTEHEFRLKGQTRGLTQSLKQAGRDVRDFGREAKAIEGRLADLSKRQSELLELLGKTDKGTAAYKKLRQQVRGTTTEINAAVLALKAMDRVQSAMDRRAGGGGVQGRSFIAGLAQGTGIAQYVPTDRGMAGRIAGAGIGSMLRGAVGGVMNPGLGGFAQALGSIPLLGGAASGAFGALASYYGQAVGFDQAKLGALMFSAPGMFGGKRNTMRLAAAQANLEAARATFGVAAGRGGTAGTPAGATEPSFLEAATSFTMGRSARHMGRGYAARTRAEVEANPMLAENAANVRAATAEFRAAKKEATRPEAAGAAIFKEGFGTQFGLGPQQAISAVTAFMRSRGGLATDAGVVGGAREALALQTFGVSAGLSGSFARGMGAGGGLTGRARMSNLFTGAQAMGMTGQLAVDYLQQLVQLSQRAEKQGVKIDTGSFSRDVATLKASGLAGIQASRISAAGLTAQMAVGQRGITNPVDLLWARAAGYDPTQGPESYMKAMMRLGGGREQFLPQFVDLARRGAGGGTTGQFSLWRMLLQSNIQVGPEQAATLLSGIGPGGELSRDAQDELNRIMDAQKKGGRGAIGAAAAAAVKAGAPLAGIAATQGAERVRAGRGMAPVMKALEQATINQAKVLENLKNPLERVSGFMETVTRKIVEFTEGGWSSIGESIGKSIADTLWGPSNPTSRP